jgi:preprotein translocase subunit SecG
VNRRTWLVAALLAVVAILGFATPASAAGNKLQLSADGVTWGNNLPGPLFAPSFRWVPGDSETRSFFVRNHTGQDAVLTLFLLPAQYGDLMASGDITVSAQVDGGAWVSATTADNTHVLVDNAAVPGKAVRKINVRVAFAAGATNATQDRVVGLAFDVSLTQGALVLAPTTGGGHGNGGVSPPGSLPGTGNDLSPLTIVLGVLLCALGAGLAVISQRVSDNKQKKREISHA